MSEQGERWPSQDDVDRSGSFAIIAILNRRDWDSTLNLPTERRWYLGDEVGSKLRQAVTAAVHDVLPPIDLPDYQPHRYQVGPAAEGFAPHWIVTIWEHKDQLGPALSALADTWAVVEIARFVKRRLEGWIQGEDPELTVSVSFPAEVLKRLCVQHVRTTYHPRARLESEWTVTTEEFYGGYISPAHPSEMVNYAVVVKTRDRAYTYEINGTGTVSAHRVKIGKQERTLDSPDLLAFTTIMVGSSESP